jgi:predicted molibdopterin-dependent oxidoreductase YjgC
LRAKIDGLRKELGALIGSRPRKTVRECAYCGARCYGRACREHRDLIQVDPSMGGTQS